MVSIIIVNFNGVDFLKDCLSSLMNQTYKDFEIILVDNGSKDNSVSFVKNHFPEVVVVEAEGNRGYATGNNIGYEHSKGENIVLLNNDTILTPNWLEELVNAIKPNEIAIASSLIITDNIPHKYYERNGSLNLFGHNIMKIFNKPENLFYCGGASLIYKKSLLGKPFDDDYFAYSEDVYLSLRARFYGYKVVHTNDSVLRHIGSATFKKEKSDFLTFYQERNRILTFLLFYSKTAIIKMFPYFVFNLFFKIILSFFPNKYSFKGVIKAYYSLMKDIKRINLKKKDLRKDFTVSENEVISWMTCKILNEETNHSRIINHCSYLYCKLVGLKTVEFYREIR